MADKSLSWWRSWHGAPTDHKWPVIAARSGVMVGIVSAIAWALFDYASQNKDRGSVVGFDAEEYSIYSGFPENDINAVIRAMEDKGLIVDGRLKNWDEYQPMREDYSTDRVRQHREMKRNETQGNALERDETHSNAPEEDVDSDKDSDKDSDADGGDDAGTGTWQPLSKAFTQATGIPELTGGPARFYKACETMSRAGVIPADITAAVGEMRDKGLAIATIGSVVNPSIIAMSKRTHPGNGRGRDAPGGWQLPDQPPPEDVMKILESDT